MGKKFDRPTKCRETGKTQYDTHEKANRGIWFIWSNDSSVSLDDLHSFVCPTCKKIHIGHKRGKLRGVGITSISS